MFHEKALLVPQYVVDEEMKKARYHEILRSDIRQFVIQSSCKTLDDMIARNREREIALEMEKKRKLIRLKVQGIRARGPRYLIRDREAIRSRVVVASAARHMMGRAGWVVLATSSAAGRIILVGIALLLPPLPHYPI